MKSLIEGTPSFQCFFRLRTLITDGGHVDIHAQDKNAAQSVCFGLMRSPTMRRIGLNGTIFSVVEVTVETVVPAGAARSTSSAKMLPSGPLPLRDARSTPFSRAILFAAGEASKRPGARRRFAAEVESVLARWLWNAAIWRCRRRLRDSSRRGIGWRRLHPARRRSAIRFPTGISSPG